MIGLATLDESGAGAGRNLAGAIRWYRKAEQSSDPVASGMAKAALARLQAGNGRASTQP